MHWLRTIRAKLWCLTGATVGILGGAQVLGLASLVDSVDAIGTQAEALARNDDVAACQHGFGELQRWGLDLAVSLQTQSEDALAKARETFAAAVARLAVHHPAESERLQQLVATFDKAMVAAVDAYTEENRVLGNSKIAEARNHATEAETIITALHAQVSARSREVGALVVTSANATLTAMLWSLAGGLLGAVILAAWLGRSIARAVHGMFAGIEGLTRNDLTTAVAAVSRDELGRMATSFTQAVTNLRQVVQRIRGTTAGLAERSSAVQSTAEQLAGGARDNAATTEEMSSTIHQITETIGLVGANSRSVSDMANLAAQTATEGASTVEQTASAMKAVHESSLKIGKITETMETIARQTNLLALNAAVEAARAGEAGRGFAVVSEEVRGLASRASRAAAEIREMIHGITQEIARGVDLSAKASDTLRRIRDEIGGAATSIGEIARATEEQSTSTEEVSKAIQVVANNTQSVSGNSEELVRVSQMLLQDIAQMQTLVATFHLGGEAVATAPTGQPAN